MFAPLWCYNAHPILWCLYDSYGLAVLQQLQDLMRSRWFVGLLILGISALIAAISSVTAAAISLTQQVHTAQYVDTMSKNVSLTLATQEAIDRKLEMRVDALEEAIMHIGTELQALKVKMALTCHTDYRWICVTSLKVNETDYEWEKIKNHISGVWNSSDIGLDLGKLHNQIQTLEHSRLDFTAAGAANDFFHTFSNLISGKKILSNLLIIILPCIVRILRQNIQKLTTELHLAVLRNKKGGDAGSRSSTPGKGHEKGGSAYTKAGSSLGSAPGYSRAFTLKNQSLPTLLLCALTSDFTGGCLSPPSRSLCQRVNLQLQLIKFLGN